MPQATPTVPEKIRSSYSATPLREFFLASLKEIYWAEQEIMTGLKKLQKATSHLVLIRAFKDHEHDTRKHIARLEKVFEWLNEQPQAKKCLAMEGILKEADEIITQTAEGTATRDATLVIAARKVEHYEIACYGGLVAIAYTLGQDRMGGLLQKTLQDEEHTDLLLSEIAMHEINFKAPDEPDELDQE